MARLTLYRNGRLIDALTLKHRKHVVGRADAGAEDAVVAGDFRRFVSRVAAAGETVGASSPSASWR